MIMLNSAEERLRDFFIARARTADLDNPEASTITFAELTATLDPDGSLGLSQPGPRVGRLTTALFHLNKYEHEHRRPMVGALAVSQTERTSGSGFAALGRELGFDIPDGKAAERQFWREQLDASVEYWSDDRPDGVLPDAQFAAIMTELAAIKKMLRQLVHG